MQISEEKKKKREEEKVNSWQVLNVIFSSVVSIFNC